MILFFLINVFSLFVYWHGPWYLLLLIRTCCKKRIYIYIFPSQHYPSKSFGHVSHCISPRCTETAVMYFYSSNSIPKLEWWLWQICESCAPTQAQWARPHCSPWGRRECRQMVKHSEMTQASPSLNTDDRMVCIPVCSEHACKHRAIRAAQTSAMLLLLLRLLLHSTACKMPN